ncbi:hypothetical protein PRIPAC_84412 [Pristionchus pacificus]|uniref:Uncharacterized protein n=1 Tax=Pristionchus pacificus TaxID=54126 RepID=A0A2A6BLK4_PRIPA|nr:hypothetical protein PRIPAC_84412 [Pristionchus pacificus]|eukprot:PDM66800.1 hypothetical protein PRIPAC_48217 [Pristionchus pacificus]
MQSNAVRKTNRKPEPDCLSLYHYVLPLISDKKNRQKLTRIWIKIGLLRVAQARVLSTFCLNNTLLDSDSFGLYMIDCTDDEYITDLMENECPNYWIREKAAD